MNIFLINRVCWWPHANNCFEPIHIALVNDIINISTLLRRGSLLWSAKADKPHNVEGLAQGCSDSIANALELLQFCIKPSIYVYQ